jgi:hypothetical protein
MGIFLPREDWICAPEASADIQDLFWFTDGFWTEEGTEAGICGPRTRLFFSLDKRYLK